MIKNWAYFAEFARFYQDLACGAFFDCFLLTGLIKIGILDRI